MIFALRSRVHIVFAVFTSRCTIFLLVGVGERLAHLRAARGAMPPGAIAPARFMISFSVLPSTYSIAM